MNKKLSNATQQLFIGIGVIVGVCIANYKNITITGLLIGFGILGILAFFFIHTKVGSATKPRRFT